ncbi:hypothetical protein NEHOM01_1504 [Nematocida homosporus]|uniref:uncharacterized protein n=1 Tax=Nematocida homosporus TaxID=1912981 RepID=UPI00221FC20E|nr:uncharacterized protein NEHOM01_1504 [Nematocida homosporus]KAI5186492.1 hypothetical protein NEHOM01_1504 [Nematocida homosporus]
MLSFWPIELNNWVDLTDSDKGVFKRINKVEWGGVGLECDELDSGKGGMSDRKTYFVLNGRQYNVVTGEHEGRRGCDEWMGKVGEDGMDVFGRKESAVGRTEVLFEGRRTVVRVWIKGLGVSRGLQSWLPGDSVLVKVSNSKDRVQGLLAYLGWKGEKWIEYRKVHIRTGRVVMSYSGRLDDCLRHCLDLTSLPSKYMLYRLGQLAGPESRAKLEYLASRAGSKDYFGLGKNWNDLYDLVVGLEVKLDLETLLELSEEIRPRAFSVLSLNAAEDEVEFLCGVVEKEAYGEKRYGHASLFVLNMIAGAAAGRTDLNYGAGLIMNTIHKPNRLMQIQAGNALLIGIGTGVAPFISFMARKEEREFVLVYGCRSRKESILHSLGIVSGDGEESSLVGAREFFSSKYQTRILIVYSQENSCLRLDQFLINNTERINDLISNLCPDTKLGYICGNKGARKAICTYITQTHPKMRLYVDDWV